MKKIRSRREEERQQPSPSPSHPPAFGRIDEWTGKDKNCSKCPSLVVLSKKNLSTALNLRCHRTRLRCYPHRTHEKSLVLAAELAAALAFLGSAKIATVATGCLVVCNVVLPQAVLHNLLSLSNVQTYLTLHSFNRRFLGLDTECGNQRSELLDVNHNQNSFAK